MTKVTTNKLVDLLRRSNLVDEAKLTAFLEKAPAAHGEAALEDQNRLAELLIEENLITRWQADKLLAGKHKGFRLGKYKLLGQIGKGGMSSVYLAEHELMKRRVAIKVLPKNRVGRFVVSGAVPPRSPRRCQARRPEHRPGLRHR